LVQELTLLQTRGSELCLAIVGPPMVRGHLSEEMQSAIVCHTDMARILAMLRAVVSSTMQYVLGHLRGEAFRVEVVDEMLPEFEE
jgi:hypothetical protein